MSLEKQHSYDIISHSLMIVLEVKEQLIVETKCIS